MRITKTLATSVLAVALISCAVPFACAQEPSSSQAPSASQTSSRNVEKGQKKEGELKESAAEEPSEDDVFRHSSAVKMVSRMTGLDIDKAFWLCMILNFIVVFAVLWFLLRKAVPTMFRNRNESIQRRLEEARKASEDARKRLTEVESRLSRLDTEIEQMRREAEQGALTEEKRVLEALEGERRRIVESAEQEITRAAGAARRELKAYAAELAVDLAEKRIHITEAVDHELVRDFASQLGKDGQ
jgi:F-type H+-transporting ATPase subunit b